MPSYNISDKDIRDAEQFLVQFQTERVPEADLAQGSAVRDLLVTGFAALYAFLRGEIDRVTARQSLLRIQSELTDEDYKKFYRVLYPYSFDEPLFHIQELCTIEVAGKFQPHKAVKALMTKK